MKATILLLGFSYYSKGETLIPNIEYFSPLKKYSTRVIALNSSAFENTKAIILKCQNPKWELGLSQNSRTYDVAWSPKENYLIIFNCGASKECEIIYVKMSKNINEIKVIQKTLEIKDRVSWKVVEWDEKNSRVLMEKIGEDMGGDEIWVDLNDKINK
jgi:hypothetical protein